MILKALYDYYKRDAESIQFGLKEQSLSFIIVIERNGKFSHIEDCRQDNIRTKYWVPAETHNNGISPLLFWDNVMYMLNYIPEDDILFPDPQQQRRINIAREKHSAFVDRCIKVAEITNEIELLSVKKFYESGELENVYKDRLWNEIKRLNSVWLSFRLKGEIKIVAENKKLLTYSLEDAADNIIGRCLITGKKGTIVRLCTDTPIIGSKNSAKLVSFNDDSFCSYNKKQCGNSPISIEAEFAFSSAFKKLVSVDSKNKLLIGNRTFVFWASNNNEIGKQAEESIWNMFGFNDLNNDDPNRGIEQVRKVFKSIYSGSLKTSLDDKFYILGLAPNSARIAVTYWAEIPLIEFAERINSHFDGMEIVDMRKNSYPYMGLKSIISSVTLSGKHKDVTPNLPESVVKSIFQGLPYPYTLMTECIRRIRAEQKISITRAAIIKAYLNRLNNSEQKIKVMLDNENKNQGYLCGRLFAVVEKIQEEANNQNSIRERYMNSASATPAMVFPTVLNLSSHHSEKLSEKRKIWFEKLKQEIVDRISSDGFPAHLDLQDQGRFFVGYYHQRQDFFEKRTTNNENE
ncbi:MAG: type I-C CRISPR-associated protein Cas8c/Csd1 [Bacteroidaceae bacterium]|nr:type I-C CRISPR-associated protein Cas8c/Csd1 [Bacteroidaceae bacterium]